MGGEFSITTTGDYWVADDSEYQLNELPDEIWIGRVLHRITTLTLDGGHQDFVGSDLNVGEYACPAAGQALAHAVPVVWFERDAFAGQRYQRTGAGA